MSTEESKSGGKIYRHGASAPVEWTTGDEELVDAVDAHIERNFGKVDRVLHEIVSPYVHVETASLRIPARSTCSATTLIPGQRHQAA